MRQELTIDNKLDENGNPTGGSAYAIGIDIRWQGNPPNMEKHNGAFVEGVLQAALGRLQFFQASKFACRENAIAITKIEEALHWLDHRTADRKARNVEGTHTK